MVVAIVAAGWATSTATQSSTIAVTGVTLIDGTGSTPIANVSVVVRGERIVEIVRSDQRTFPGDTTTVDGHGKFLIPGLWDMHVHIGSYTEGVELLRRLVDSGITGVRDMASPVDDILRLRAASEARSIVAPAIVAAGPILQRPLPFALPPLVRTVTDAEAAGVVADLRSRGVDFIKVGDTLTRGAYLSIAAESKRRRLPFAGHLPVSVSALEATNAGQRSIEHFGSAGFRNVLIGCSRDESALSAYARDVLAGAVSGGPSPDDKLYEAAFTSRLVNTYDSRKALDLFARFVRNGIWHVPTLVAIRKVWTERRQLLAPGDAAASDRAAMKTVEMFADMRKAGVRVMAGTDLPTPADVSPLHDELVALVESGMTPMEAIQSATRAPAEFLGRLAIEGTIERGKKANLVLLDGDPLANIVNTRRVSAVILRGRIVRGSGAAQSH